MNLQSMIVLNASSPLGETAPEAAFLFSVRRFFEGVYRVSILPRENLTQPDSSYRITSI
jgi:hypothetical protein